MGTSLLLSISIAFYYNWLLTFVVLGVMPLIIIGSTIHFQIASKNGHDKSADISAVKKVCDGSRWLRNTLTNPPAKYGISAHFLSRNSLSWYT